MGEVADDLAEMLAAQGPSNSQCAVCALLLRMTPEHRESLEAAFDDDRIRTSGIIVWLTKRGYSLDRKVPQKVLLTHKKNHRA